MIGHFLKIAFRFSRKEKGFTLLNIFGLALGFAGFLLSYQYINREKSYDRWNTGYDQIYSIGLSYQGQFTDQTPPSLGKTLKERIPEVIEAGLYMVFPYGEYPLYNDQTEGKSIIVKNAGLIDRGAAEIFEVQKHHGPLFTEENQKEASLMTRNLAEALFTPEQLNFEMPVYVSAYNRQSGLTDQIYGIWDNSRLTYLDFDVLFIKEITSETSGNPYQYQTFIKIENGSDLEHLTRKINDIYQNETSKHALVASGSFAQGEIFLEPLAKLHLRPQSGSNTAYLTVWVLGILSILILVLAASNFANLILAQSDSRTKEIGMKKALGVSKKAIMFQFLSEVFVQCILAAAIAWGLLVFAASGLEKWFNEDIRSLLLDRQMLGQLGIMILCTTLLAGWYPAMHLSRIQVISLLKGKNSYHLPQIFVRHSLMVFQFVMAIVFISGMFVVKKQMDYINSTDKGFHPEQVIHFSGLGFYFSPFGDDILRLQERVQDEESILWLTATNQAPGSPNLPPSHQFQFIDKKADFDHVGVEPGYFESLDIQIMEGEAFRNIHKADTSLHYAVLNETAAQMFGDQVLGSIVRGCGLDFRIIGIARDSKVYGFEQKIAPTLYSAGLECGPGRYKTSVLVKSAEGQAEQAIALIEKLWKEKREGDTQPLQYHFLDQQYAALHDKQAQLQRVFNGFTLMTVFIAGMGLFVMSAYRISQRRKEISIRKVMGANARQLFLLLNRPYFKILILAHLLAIPLAITIFSKWLDNFAYKISLNVWIFLVPAALILSMVLIIISYHSHKTSADNPINALREE